MTYNIKNGTVKKWGCLTTRVVQRKRTCCTCPDVVSSPSSSPPDKGPKENPSPTNPRRPPIKFPHYQCVVPGTDPMVSPHPRIQCSGPLQRIHTQNPQPTTCQCPQELASEALPSSYGYNHFGVTHQNVTYVVRESCPHQGPSSTKRARASIPTPSATATRAPRNGPGLSGHWPQSGG